MKTNKKIWKIGILFSLVIILFMINNADASWFGDIFGGGHCYSWMPPGTDVNKGAQACGQCGVINNVAGLVPCTEYSCHSLGVDCVFDETTNLCTEQSTNDRSAPSIVECKAMDLMTQKYYTVEKKNRACAISGQVEAYSAVAFYLTLDEAGTCSISEDPAFNFEDGEQLITDTGGISRNQFFIYPTGSGEFNCNGMCTFYVKCADYNGNIMDSYTLEFIAKEAPDKAPPIIFGYSLISGAHILQSTTSINPFYLVAMDNEGVKECRYSSNSNADYNSAELMECSSTIDIDAGGWKCTKAGGLTTPANENKYYFKCKDVNNNVMPNWNEFRLLKVTSTLNVGITSPGAEIRGTSNVLRVGVSGYEQGISSCLYDIKWRGGGDTTELTPSVEMTKESEGIYSANLNLVNSEKANSGGYDVKVECIDGVGQTASDEKSFNYVNEPLKFTFNPVSVASATQNNFLDVTLTVTGGRNGKGDTSECRYKRFGISDDLSTVKFSDLNVVLHKDAPQIYQIKFSDLLSGINRFYVMCEDFDARGNYYGEEYKIDFNPSGLVIEQQPSHSEVRQTTNGYEVDLYLILSGGPDADGSATCYYNDKFISGMYTNFNTNQYKDSFTKGEVIDYSGKEARKYTKTVSISPNVLVDFYIRCADKYNGLTNTIKHSVLYTPTGSSSMTCSAQSGDICSQSESCSGNFISASDSSSKCCSGTCTTTGGGTPECTLNSNCDSGEICNSLGECVSSNNVITPSSLTIVEKSPDSDITGSSATLRLVTTGGSADGDADCYYSATYNTDMNKPIFSSTLFGGSNNKFNTPVDYYYEGTPAHEHTREISVSSGAKRYYVRCKHNEEYSDLDTIEFNVVAGLPDADGDGVQDSKDNCLDIANPGQADMDGDGKGDVCDDNIDGDQTNNNVDPDPDNPDVECDSNSDCGTGKTCNANGACVPSTTGPTGTEALTVLSFGPSGTIGTSDVKLFIALTGGDSEFGRNLNCYYTSSYQPEFVRTTGITLDEFNQFFSTPNKLDQNEVIRPSGMRYYKTLSLDDGDYDYFIACKDSANSISDVKEVRFSVSIDNIPPIIQFYTEGGLFKVRLNEEGSCFIKSGEIWTGMTTDSEKVIHSTPVRIDKTYMIKCKDLWNIWRPGPSETDFITVVKNG